jgi:hypothetical protein
MKQFLPKIGREYPSAISFRFSALCLPFFLFLFSLALPAKAQEASFQNLKEIHFSTASIHRLFDLKQGETGKLTFSDGANAKLSFSLSVLNHINKGENSGALALILTFGKEEARLLMNRKFRNGKLVYWLAVLPTEGKEGFKLTGDGKSEFVLSRIPKSEVVSE